MTEISGLDQKARRWAHKLDKIKSQLRPADFSWYPYHSLKSFAYTVSLLSRETHHLLEQIADGAILDVGCGDGDVAFLLESLGCKVTAIDHPSPNWNGMRGVKLQAQTLHSSVEVRNLISTRNSQSLRAKATDSCYCSELFITYR